MIISLSKNKKLGYTLTDKTCDSFVYKKHLKKIKKKTMIRNFYKENASIHKSKIVRNSMKRIGIKPIYGIPYTPELNIVEYFINILKKKLYEQPLESRQNIERLIQKTWESIDDSIITKIYNNIYGNKNFYNKCI